MKLWLPGALYATVTSVFLILLNRLNKTLLSEHLDDKPFDLLKYHNYEPLKFFAFALLLSGAGLILIVCFVRKLRTRYDSFVEICFALATILLVAILMILIFVFINNPILRAIIGAMSIICVLVCANN